ncbi:MAG: hypothetical protein IH607_02480 [Firmicutes bacterium]|nr:hypothetical protein [Bacillota bacterium]
MMYATNNGAVRVGYVDGQDIKGSVDAPYLQFAYETAVLTSGADLTDDPATESSSILRLSAGQQVTYLSTFYNRNAWAYVETSVSRKTVRGFIPADAIDWYSVVDEDTGE